MNSSLYSADRRTHVKVAVVGLVSAFLFVLVGLGARIGQNDPRSAPVVRAGGPHVVSGQLPVIR